jgi:ABC-type ATPase with predicted acetyltransferase domain
MKDVLTNLKNLDLKLTGFSELLEVEDVESREEKLGGKLRFRINIRYRTKVEVTARTIAVAEAFGIGIGEPQEFIVYNNLELFIGVEDIVYITGARFRALFFEGYAFLP